MMRFLLSSLLLISLSLWARPLEVTVSAKSAILMNAETGAILYEKEPHLPCYPASITKVATALYALEQQGDFLDQDITVSGDALRQKSEKNKESHSYWLEQDGTTMGLVKGEVISLDSLLHGLMLVSGNDAANVIAESVGGSITQFVEQMNLYVKSLGCKNTQFLNPHGLHHPEHVTTAYDMSLIAKRALQIHKFRQIVSKVSYVRPKTNKRSQAEIHQSNALLKPGPFYYPKALGIKTGHTSHAMHTLVTAAEHDGRVLIAVLLGCDKKTARYEDAKRLFEKAFAEPLQKLSLVHPQNVFTKEIVGAPMSLRAALKSELSIEFYPAEEPICKAFIHWGALKLPIQKGQKVGEMQILDDRGTLLAKGDLVAQEELKGTWGFRIKEAISSLFH